MAGSRKGEAVALVHSGGHSASEDSAAGSSAELPGSRKPPARSGLRRRLASGAVAAATTVLLLMLLGQQGSGGALLKTTSADEGDGEILQLAKVDSSANATGKLYVVGHGGCAVSSNYTWTAPYTGVIRVLVVGAGGGGSSGTEGGGAGGNGGSVSEKDFNVTAGENFTLIIGEGGSGGVDDETPGEDGGDSAFESLTAHGGRGGQIGEGGGKGGECFANCPVGNGSLAMVSVPDFSACLKGSPQLTVSDVAACVNKARREGTEVDAETISAATQVNLTQFSVCMQMTASGTSDSVTDCLNTSMGAADGGECGIGGRGIMSCITGECISFGGGGGAGSDAHECGGVDTGGVGGGGRGGAPGAEPDGRPGADSFGGGGGGGGATARSRGAHGGDGGKGVVILKYLMVVDFDTKVPDTPMIDTPVRALAASNADDVSNENDMFCNLDQFCVFPDDNGLGQILCRGTPGGTEGRCPGQGDPEFPKCTPGEKKVCACEQKLEGGVQQKTCQCPKEGDCFYAVPPEECALSGQKFCAFPEISSPSKILCRALDGKCPKQGDPEFAKCTPGAKQACACETKLTGDVQQKTCDCPENGDCFFAVPPVAGADDGNETAENQSNETAENQSNETAENQSNGSAEVNATGYKMYMNFCATAEDQDTAHTEIGRYDVTKCLALCTMDPTCSAVEHGGVNEDEGVTCFHILSEIPATKGFSGEQYGDARCYVKIDFVASNSSSCNGTNGSFYVEFQNFCADANDQDTDHTEIGDQDPEECKALCSKDPKCSAVEWGGVDEDEGRTCFHIRDGPPAVRGSFEEQHGDAKCFVKRSCDNETSNQTSRTWTIGASGIVSNAVAVGAADLEELAKLTPSWCKADEEFDCAAGYNNWKAGWSLAKKRWCCEHYKLSCEDKPFDCEEGLDNWEDGWSLDKIAWCCDSEGKGCGPDGPFDCEAGFSNWKAGWSKTKKAWCCEQRSRGCEESAAEDFDCDAGFANWKEGWSPEKKAFCCEQVQMGCEGMEATNDLAAATSGSTSTSSTSTIMTTAASTYAASTSTAAMSTTSMMTSTTGIAAEVEFDCDAGLSNWEAGWTEAKKTYCCEKAQKGCKTEVEFDCDAGFWNWEAGWSDAKKEYCCKKAQKGCKKEATEFDCDAGYSNWRAGWSEAKQAYCCEKAQKGCLSGAEFDCDEGFFNWEAGWSYAKKAYCCEKVQRGCGISAPFDCDAGYSNWEAGWSDAKKAYCCENAQKGCDTSDPFDCDAGFSNWKEGWSDAKKTYCCRKSQRGCEGEAIDKPPFDCLSDIAGGKHPKADVNYWYGWSEEKKSFCCKWEEMGCLKDPFDCDADLEKWSTGWSEKKKEWCCKVYKRGC